MDKTGELLYSYEIHTFKSGIFGDIVHSNTIFFFFNKNSTVLHLILIVIISERT